MVYRSRRDARPSLRFLSVPTQTGQVEAAVSDCRRTSPVEAAAGDYRLRGAFVAVGAVLDCHPPEVRLQNFARQQNYLGYSYLSQLQKRPLLPL